MAGARKVPRMARRGHARIVWVETHRLPFLGYLWRWVLVLILTLISQLCHPRRCNVPGQATRYHWRAAVPATPIRNSSTTAPDARLGAWARWWRQNRGCRAWKTPVAPSETLWRARLCYPEPVACRGFRYAECLEDFSPLGCLSPFQTSPSRRAPRFDMWAPRC